MDLVGCGTLTPGRSPWIHHVILPGVGMHLLQQLTPAQFALAVGGFVVPSAKTAYHKKGN